MTHGQSATPGPTPAGAAVLRTSQGKPKRSKAAAYMALTKPRIIELLLTTTIPTMIVAAGGWPGFWLVVLTILGGFLAAGSANTFNMIIDRDIDALMKRTSGRPLVTGEISVRGAYIFGLVLAGASLAIFAIWVNIFSAGLTLAAILLYVVFYTLILKRHTEQNIVWGGIAGCMPVLIGWAAVTGTLSWEPWILFGIIFFWTPPHYWPLSMRFKEDYARAGVPMLPTLHDGYYVAKRVVAYAILTVACTLVFIPVASIGPIYTITAALAGAAFLWQTLQLLSTTRAATRAEQALAENHNAELAACGAGTDSGAAASSDKKSVAQREYRTLLKKGRKQAMGIFHGSITYLSVIFLALAIDPFFF